MPIMTTTQSRTGSRKEYLDSLRSTIRDMTTPKGQSNNQFYNQKNDERYWKLDVDKSGTGSAVIRFLPTRPGAAFPFVRLWTHGFQGPTGKWFIDNCPSSLHPDKNPSDLCPVCKDNTALYNADKDKDSPLKKLASSRKRKLSYVSNILVIKDPKHPENDGKVFLFKYGKKIFEKIKDQIDPPAEFADMQPVDPFDAIEGANFMLRQVKVDGFPNYDKSTFASQSAIGDEDTIAKIEAQMFDLNTVVDPKLFKTYEKLNERFMLVTGEGSQEAAPSQESAAPAEQETPVARRTPPPTPERRTAPAAVAGDDDEDNFDYLSKLASQRED